MATENLKQRPTPNVIPVTTGARAPWSRPLAVATAPMFLISSAFPVVAGLSKNTASFPKWWGMLDVGLAFVLAILAFGVMVVIQGKVDRQAVDASNHAYRILNHGILVMLIVFFVFGHRIVWINCLTGFAWRAWLLVYVLPAWFTALRASAASQPPDAL